MCEQAEIMITNETIQVENAMFVQKHLESLQSVRSALKFSGVAFLALGATQFLCESSVVASLDEFAFGVFLLDAASTLKRLLNQRTDAPAADELCAALKSIGDTHSIFAWVTSYQTAMVLTTFFGLRPMLLDALAASAFVKDIKMKAEEYVYVVGLLKLGVAAAGLRFGGLRYARTKLAYWSRATLLAANLLADKLSRLFQTKGSLNNNNNNNNNRGGFFHGDHDDDAVRNGNDDDDRDPRRRKRLYYPAFNAGDSASSTFSASYASSPWHQPQSHNNIGHHPHRVPVGKSAAKTL